MLEHIEWLRLFIDNHRSFEYLIIFVGSILGGEVALFVLGFFVAQKVLSLPSVVMLGFVGAFIPNILWFLCGKTQIIHKIISNRYAHSTFASVTEAISRFGNHNNLIALIIIKFLVGTPILLIMYTHKTLLSFKKFMYYEFVAIFLSFTTLVSIGFISGLGFTYFAEILENIYASFGLILLVIVLIRDTFLNLINRFK
jgi:membrane protein DedA with SNARE-associated domain